MSFTDKINSVQRVVVYGAQAIASGVVYSLIDVFKKIPEALIVSDISGNPMEICGIKVIALAEAVNLKDCLVLIATPQNLHNDIINVLTNYGFNNYIAIDSILEYELMSQYFRKTGRFKMLDDLYLSDVVSDTKIFLVRSVFDKNISCSVDLIKKNIVEIQAGAALTDIRFAEKTDVDGKNISKNNNTFCELTVTYWVWKNVKANYKGIFHYRRLLDISDEDYKRISTVDVVLPLPFIIYPNASSQFMRFIHDDEFCVLLSVLKQLAPRYYIAAHKYWYESYLYNYNILVAKESVFDSYCEFLFEILFAVSDFFEKRCVQRSDRYLGYLGEILTSLYFMVNSDQLNIAHAKKIWLV